MPLTRYQIRNEYGLADPELYRAADKDDPEALLEGVAMAGLVGVLRQLGDLAEFAAEIFHDLHEEVMATASRGHGLMVRVQQLEAEFPSIEKVILSQTSHTSFFSNEGVDWHPNLHSEQNLIARGDLPRFVMDSYEECRGPPRLFLLDKFDVAGAGACLKRYTDPSFFKVEYGIETESRPREKKIRRVKPKKGPRWRNGGAPEAGPTSAKLHQLLLEERIENGYNDPARLVKLKKRQLSGSGIDSRTGKSYMERFLETPSPEHKMICEASVAPPSLQLPSEDTTEVGVKILDMIRVSPVASDSPGRESTPSSMVEEEILGPSTDEEITGREIVLVSEPITDGVTEENLLILNKCVVENELIGGEVNAKTIVDEDHSDDMTSEVDNYMDALTTMDSEVDIDNENRSKNDQHFLNIGKHRIEADANEDNLDPQDQFLDPQSFGNSSVSDDGNSSFKKDRSSSSCSDTVSNLGKHRIEVDANEDNLEPQDQFLDPQSFGNSSVSYDGNSSFKKDRSSSSCSDTVSSIGDNTTSDGDIGAKAFLSTPTTGTVDIADAPSSPRPIVADSEETKAHERQLSLETYVDEEKLTNFGVISSSSCPLDLNPALPNSDPETNSSVNLVVGDIEDKTPYDHVSFDSKTSKTMTGLDDIEDVHPDVPSLSRDETYHTVISEFHSVNDVESDVTVDAFLPSSNTLELASEKKIDNACYDELLQREYQDENSAENCFVDSVSTSSTPRQDQLLTSTSMEVESCSDISLLQDNLPAVPVKDGSSNVNSKDHLFEVVNNVTETEVKSEDLPPSTHILSDGPVSKTNGVILEAGLAELHPFNSEEKSNTEENSSLVDVSEMVPFVCNMCVVEANVALTKLPSDYLNNADCEGHINLDESATETVPEDDVNISISADAIPVELTSVGHVEQEENPCFDDIATKAFQPEDVAVSASSGHETAAFFELPSKIINDPILEDQVYSYDFSTLRFQAEDAIVSIVRKTDDEVDEVVCPSLDVISFPSREGEYLHQDDSVFSDQQPLELQINEQVLPQEFQINEQVTPEGFTNEESSQFKIGSTHLDSTSYSKLKILEIVCSSTPNSQFQAERLSVDDVNTCPIAFERRNLELESESPCQSHDFGDMDDIISSPSCLPHSQTLLEQSMGLPLNRLGEHLQAYEEINNVSESFCWEKMDSLNDMDEDNHEKVQSSNLEDCKSCFDTSFQSLGESLPSVPSESKSSPQSGLEEFKSANGAVDHQLPCFVPSFVPLPEAAPVGLEEMPPLPPLPPMQWRLGRIQPTFPAVSGELIEAHGNPFLSMLPSKADSKAKFGSLTADGQPQNPFVCLTESESEITNNVSEQFPIVFSSDALQNSQLTLDDTQSSNPFGTLPAVSNEKPEHVEMLLSKLKPSSHMPMIEDSACEPDNVSFLGNSSHPMNKLSSETGSKFVKLQQTLQNSEGEQWSDPVSSAPSALIKDEQPQPSLMSLEGERASFSNTPAMASTSEVGNPNGNHTSKIARPRNPLIDAAVAHGQSKLRKAADRVLPQIGAKGEERDSLLQQIRTKSFNLKPALSARPNIQGPKHNLKVAAILEKANAIRQALAGSDEDDDNNSWSDSD